MMGDGSQIDPVANLVEEFLERYRRGERPSVTEYTQRFPELGERVREVLPMMVMIEQAGLTETDKPALEPPSAATSGTGGIPQQVGDYRILREIGKGGMGVVYEAEQLSLGRRVALKFLSRHIAHDAKLMERFRREARAAAQLHHTNIVPVFDVGQQDGICYYAMQRIQGHPLDQVLVELRQLRSGSADIKHPAQPADADTPTAVQIAHSLRSGLQLTEPAVQGAPCEAPDDSSPLQSPIDRAARTVHSAAELTKVSSAVLPGQSPLSRTESDGWHYYRSVAEVGVQVADALAYAHQEGIIHRDIKPSNLLLGRYFRSRRELQESLTWYEKGGRTLQAARQAAPDDRKVRKYLYSSLGGHASILYQLGRFEAAIPVYEQATELGPQIARDHPRDPQWNQRLHGHWYFLGLCLEIQQQHERSEFAFRKAAEVAEALIQTHPEQLEYQLTFGERCWWIGDYVRQGGRPRDALGWFTRSLEILEPLQQQLPENAKARLYLGRAYQGRAQSYEQLDEPQKAAEAREQAKKFQ